MLSESASQNMDYAGRFRTRNDTVGVRVAVRVQILILIALHRHMSLCILTLMAVLQPSDE
jgi:hypothetical protein